MGFIKVPAHSCTYLNETDVIIEKSRNNVDNNIKNNNVRKREIYYSTKKNYLYNQDFLEKEGLLMVKRQAESSKVYEIQKYTVVSKIRKNRTTTKPHDFKAITITNKIETSTTTTIKQRKARPNPSLKSTANAVENGVNSVVNKILDNSPPNKTVDNSLKAQPNEIVNNTVNDALEEIVDDIKNATENIEVSKKPIESSDVSIKRFVLLIKIAISWKTMV